MARSHRRRRRSPIPAIAALVIVGGGGGWYFWQDDDKPTPTVADDRPPLPVIVSNRPEVPASGFANEDVPERGDQDSADPHARTPTAPGKAAQLMAAGRRALEEDDFVPAREQLSEAFRLGVEPSEQARLREELTRLANRTIFSPGLIPEDNRVSSYTIATGDTLGKIAKKHKITAGLLSRINGIENPNLIRAGQRIKVLEGPFHAVVHKEAFTMDVLLGDLFVRQFKVGLGEEGSTPTGTWKVSTKLENPTYYPPRSGQIIAADDPENPLGERWLGLEGIAGDAVGQLRYGIHGTIDPESIGTNASLGCIRMYNEDVEFLYDVLVTEHSTVEVVR